MRFGVSLLVISLFVFGCAVDLALPEKNGNADLAYVNISVGELSPQFSSDNINYVINIPNEYSAITISGIASSNVATVSNQIELTGIETKREYSATITVTAENGNIKVYGFKIYRLSDANSALREITYSSGSLTPNFLPSIFIYQLNLEYEDDSVTISGVPESMASIVSDPIIINDMVPETEYPGILLVTAENGSKSEYHFTIIRRLPIPTTDLITADILNYVQTYSMPYSFYVEKTVLEDDASDEISSLWNLYMVGAINGSTYQQLVSEVNAQLAQDIIALEQQYLQTDIYSDVNLDIRIYNDNLSNISVIINVKITTADGSEYENNLSVLEIITMQYKNGSISINTNGKKAFIIGIDQITII